MKTHTIGFEPFNAFLEEAISEIKRAQTFLIKSSEEPSLLYKEAHIYLKHHENVVQSVLNISYLKDEDVNIYSFQAFLASLLNEELRKWCNEQKLDMNVQVLVRNTNTSPSIFGVYVDKMEIMQFNIFEQLYGIRQKPLSDVEIQESNQKQLDFFTKGTSHIQEKLIKYENIRKKPFSKIYSLKDFWIFLFKRKEIEKNLDVKISNLSIMLENRKKEEADIKLSLENHSKLTKKRQEYIDSIEPFFLSLNYRLETDKQKLY